MYKKTKILFLMFIVVLFFVPAAFAGKETEGYVQEAIRRIQAYNPKNPNTAPDVMEAQHNVILTEKELGKIANAVRRNPRVGTFAFQMIFPQLQQQWNYNLEAATLACHDLIQKGYTRGGPAMRKRDFLAASHDSRCKSEERGQGTCTTFANCIDVILELFGFDENHRGLIHIKGEPGHVFNVYWIDGLEIHIADGTVAARSGAWPAETAQAYLSEIPAEYWENDPQYCYLTHFVDVKKDQKAKAKSEKFWGDPYQILLHEPNPYTVDPEKDFIVDKKRKTVIFGSGREVLSRNLVNKLCLRMIDEELFDFTIVIPNSVKEIEPFAFIGQDVVSKVDLSQSQVETIQRGTFYDCENLTEVNFNPNIKEIEPHAFGWVLLKNKTLRTNIGGTTYGKQWGISNDLVFESRGNYSNGAFGKAYQDIFGLNQIKYSRNDITKIGKTVEIDERSKTITIGIDIGSEYREDGQDFIDPEYVEALKFVGFLKPGWIIVVSPKVKDVDLKSFSNCKFKKFDISPLKGGTEINSFPTYDFEAEEFVTTKANSHRTDYRDEDIANWCFYCSSEASTAVVKKVVTPVHSLIFLPHSVLEKVEELQLTDLDQIARMRYEDNQGTLVIENISQFHFHPKIYEGLCHYQKLKDPQKFSKINKIKFVGNFLNGFCEEYSFPHNIKEFEWNYPTDEWRGIQVPRLNFQSDEIHPEKTIKAPCKFRGGFGFHFIWGNTPNIKVIDNKNTPWEELENHWHFHYDPRTTYTHITTDEEISSSNLNFFNALIKGHGGKSDICVLNKSLTCDYACGEMAATAILYKVFVVNDKKFKFDGNPSKNGDRFWDQAIFWGENSEPTKETLQNANATGFYCQMPQVLFNDLVKKKIMTPNLQKRTVVTDKPTINFMDKLIKQTRK